MIELLGEEVRISMPPYESFEGFSAVSGFFRDLLGEGNPGDWRLVTTRANGGLAWPTTSVPGARLSTGRPFWTCW